MKVLLLAVNRIINSVWTLSYYDEGNNIIEIVSINRTNQDGIALENELPTYKLKESENRTVLGATIDGVYYNVSNPKRIFSYK